MISAVAPSLAFSTGQITKVLRKSSKEHIDDEDNRIR